MVTESGESSLETSAEELVWISNVDYAINLILIFVEASVEATHRRQNFFRRLQEACDRIRPARVPLAKVWVLGLQ